MRWNWLALLELPYEYGSGGEDSEEVNPQRRYEQVVWLADPGTLEDALEEDVTPEPDPGVRLAVRGVDYSLPIIIITRMAEHPKPIKVIIMQARRVVDGYSVADSTPRAQGISTAPATSMQQRLADYTGGERVVSLTASGGCMQGSEPISDVTGGVVGEQRLTVFLMGSLIRGNAMHFSHSQERHVLVSRKGIALLILVTTQPTTDS